MIELNRRAMMSYDSVGRVFTARIPKIGQNNDHTDENGPNPPFWHNTYCNTFNLTEHVENYCDWSKSKTRAWYCYGKNLNCSKKNVKINHSIPQYTLMGAKWFCNVTRFPDYFQQKAFLTSYLQSQDIPIDKNFKHWIDSRIHETAQSKNKISAIFESDRLSVATKLNKKTFVIIGDSIGTPFHHDHT